MKIKVGDKIKILSGKDKGKSGKVLQVFVAEERVVVEGLNLMIKNQKGKKQGEKGQRIQFPCPINISNLALICPRCGAAARVGYKMLEDGSKKSRMCKKCQEAI